MDVSAQKGVAVRATRAPATSVLEGLAALVDEWAHGALLATLEGLVLHANPVAQLELRRNAVVGMHNQRLKGATPDNDRRLHKALSQVAKGRRGLLAFAQADGANVTLAVIPLRSETGCQADRAAVVFARTAICEAFMLCFFARSHGLTRTEELVLGILLQGFSAPEVAEQMKVAVSTIRSHIRSLCFKTRSSGVRELLKRVAVLPPVAAAVFQDPMQ